MSNASIIKDFLDKMIIAGSEISSKNYMIIVLTSALNDKKKKYPFLDSITIGNNVIIVDPKINTYKNTEVIIPLNDIYESIFLDISKRTLREKTDQDTIQKFISFGLRV